MSEFKLVVNDPKSGKSFSKTVSTDLFKGKKISDMVSGNEIGLSGYELEITGGSDKAGFPMRKDLNLSGRKRVLLSRGPCIKIKRKGMRKRKTVVGNQINLQITQVNLKIVKEGSKKISEVFGVKDEIQDKEHNSGEKKEGQG